MTPDLHDRIDDLVAGVPAYVVPDARAAWAAGARRRTRHRVGVLAAAAIVVALLAGAVAWLPRTFDPAPADSDGAGVEGYPSRVYKPLLERDLPDRPGPLAGLLDDDSTLWAVSASGRVWVLPREDRVAGYPTAISSDGTAVAYLRRSDEYVLRDLRAGTTTVADGVDDGTFDGRTETRSPGRFAIALQSPAFWSPDRDRVFVLGSSNDDFSGTRALLIGGGASTMAVQAPRVHGESAGWPAGWTPDGNLVWLDGDFDRDHPRWAVVVVTTPSGREVRRVELDLPSGVGHLGQWSGSVSPDGTRLSLISQAEVGPVFSLSDGKVVDETSASEQTCPMSWSAGGPRPPFLGSGVAAVRDGEGRPIITVDPAFEATCGIWASDALSGVAHDGLGGRMFGSSSGWLSWHWREVGLGIVAGGGVLALVVLVVRRRRKALEPTS